MITEFEAIMKKLDEDLANMESECNLLKRIARCRELVKAAVRQVAKIDGFGQMPGNTDLAIQVKKEMLPLLFSKLIFYRLFFELAIYRESSSAEEFQQHCGEKLCFVREWQIKNGKFIAYYYSGRNDLDYYEFVARKRGGILVSKLLAFEAFAKLLKTELLEKENSFEPATWIGTKSELVEQIIGEHSTGHTVVNGEAATLGYLVARAEKMYPNISLKNFGNIASQIRKRQEGSTTYHEKKITLIKGRADELLERKKINR